MQTKKQKDILKLDPVLSFSYPIYVIGVLSENYVIVAGGGGAVKTGVPNRIDIVKLERDESLSLVNLESAGGIDTGLEVIMNMSVISQGNGAFIATLEGQKCVEYTTFPLLRMCKNNVQCFQNEFSSTVDIKNKLDKIAKLCKSKAADMDFKTLEIVNEYVFSHQNNLLTPQSLTSPKFAPFDALSTSDIDDPFGCPNCVAYGGMGGSWYAIGSDQGIIRLINRQFRLATKSTVGSTFESFHLHTDLSCGHGGAVSSLALSLTTKCFSDNDDPSTYLAVICDKPNKHTLQVWSLSIGSPDEVDEVDLNQFVFNNRLYATASCTNLLPQLSIRRIKSNLIRCLYQTRSKDTDNTKHKFIDQFRHCQFMKYSLDCVESGKAGIEYNAQLLVTTTQPVCANRYGISRLIVWFIPSQPSSSNPVELATVAHIQLSPGQMIACMDVHKSSSRGLIGVGFMDGRVDVYFLSPIDFHLKLVYTLPNAHPIFVTALSFIPQYSANRANRKDITTTTTTTKHFPSSYEASFELLSVSVDRTIKWHRGPTLSQIAKVLRGIDEPLTKGRWWCFPGTATTFQLVVMFNCWLTLIFLPVVLASCDKIMSLLI